MTKKVVLFVVATMFISASSLAEQDVKVLSHAEQSCMAWAEEDGIAREEMMNYMLKCLIQIKNIDNQNEEESLQTSINIENQLIKIGEKE